MDVTKKRIQFKFINKPYLRRKSRHFSYLFLNHKLLAQYITRLEGNIWSHCTPKASPVSNNYHQAKYFIAELRDTNKKEFNKCHGHVFQLYISFKNDFHKVYVAERTSFRTLASWALFVYAWCCIIITVWNKKNHLPWTRSKFHSMSLLWIPILFSSFFSPFFVAGSCWVSTLAYPNWDSKALLLLLL